MKLFIILFYLCSLTIHNVCLSNTSNDLIFKIKESKLQQDYQIKGYVEIRGELHPVNLYFDQPSIHIMYSQDGTFNLMGITDKTLLPMVMEILNDLHL